MAFVPLMVPDGFEKVAYEDYTPTLHHESGTEYLPAWGRSMFATTPISEVPVVTMPPEVVSFDVSVEGDCDEPDKYLLDLNSSFTCEIKPSKELRRWWKKEMNKNRRRLRSQHRMREKLRRGRLKASHGGTPAEVVPWDGYVLTVHRGAGKVDKYLAKFGRDVGYMVACWQEAALQWGAEVARFNLQSALGQMVDVQVVHAGDRWPLDVIQTLRKR